MKILLAIFCLIMAIIIMLFIPVALRFIYKDGDLRIFVRYLFIKVRVFPLPKVKKGKQKPAAQKSDKQEADDKDKDKHEKQNVTLQDVWGLVKSSKWALGFIRRRITFYRIKIYILAAGDDAHKTAVFYTRLASAIYIGLEIMRELFKVKEPDVRIAPDFLRDSTYCDISFNMRIKPIVLLVAAASLFIAFLKLKIKKPKPDPKQTKTDKLSDK